MKIFSRKEAIYFSVLAGSLIMASWNVWAKGDDDKYRSASTAQVSEAAAPKWSFAPVQVQSDLAKADWNSALINWNIKIAGSSYADSADGKALYSLILVRNGLPTLAIETLFHLNTPGQISPALRTLLATEFPASHPLWSFAEYKWKSEWTSVFGKNLELRRVTIENKSLNSEKDFAKTEGLTARAEKDSAEWARLQWLLGTSRAVQNQTAKAQKHFQTLLTSKQNTIGKDQIMMGIARVQFQDGKFQSALQSYNTISKNSDYWLEALEEKAWTQIRLNDYRKALGELQTVLTPVFAAELGPEPYFVNSFSNLKICDFEGVFKTHEQFKERYRGRTAALDQLAKTGRSAAADTAIQKLISGVSRWAQLGPDAETLPRFIHRDQIMEQLISRQRNLLNEQVHLGNLVSDAKQNFTSSRMESHLGNLQNYLGREIEKGQNKMASQIKKLAKSDLEEVSRILRKLHIVEAEAIQRLHLYDKLAKNTDAADDEKVESSDVLVFPHQGEIWLDELDHYQVNTTGCPQLPSKKGS